MEHGEQLGDDRREFYIDRDGFLCHRWTTPILKPEQKRRGLMSHIKPDACRLPRWWPS
jgi:hypothetical protein